MNESGAMCEQEKLLFYLNCFMGVEDLVSLFHLQVLYFTYP